MKPETIIQKGVYFGKRVSAIDHDRGVHFMHVWEKNKSDFTKVKKREREKGGGGKVPNHKTENEFKRD